MPALGREDTVLTTEFEEWHSDYWTQKMLENPYADPSFEESWLAANEDGTHASGLAHAEYYRRKWDVNHGFKYLANHREEIQRKLA